MKILVTGSNGQLGTEIRKRESQFSEWDFIYVDLPELDITDVNQVEQCVVDNSISAIVNCAAYTAVDKAEEDQAVSEKVNAYGPEVLAKVAAKHGIFLLHISTDFVFDGKTHLPYVETDVPSPVSVYGETKLKGEVCVQEFCPNSVILRTAWLYSAHGNNFVKTMRRLGGERDSLNVIFDQIGTPTWAGDLADACLCVLAEVSKGTDCSGIYHYSNEGVASWYDFAVEIMNLSEIDCDVRPILTEDYPTPAKRPCYSVLNKNKIKKVFGMKIPHWKSSLKNCIREIGE